MIQSQRSRTEPGRDEPVSGSEDHQERDAKRMIRAVKKVAYDMLREQRKAREPKEDPEPMIRVFATLADQVGSEHQKHRAGRHEVYDL
jgi:hypothetical protein